MNAIREHCSHPKSPPFTHPALAVSNARRFVSSQVFSGSKILEYTLIPIVYPTVIPKKKDKVLV